MEFKVVDVKEVHSSTRSPGKWSQLQSAFAELKNGKALAVTLGDEKATRVKSAIVRHCEGKSYSASFAVKDGTLYITKVAKSVTVPVQSGEGA